MLKSITFEEKISDSDIQPIKRHRSFTLQEPGNNISMVPYNDTSRILVCSLCKAYILSYFFVCQICGLTQGETPALYCPSCVCEGFHCSHTESFLLYKTRWDTDYLEGILERVKEQFPEIYAQTQKPTENVLSYMSIAYTMTNGAKSGIHATCHQCKLSKTLDKIAFCTFLHQDLKRKKNATDNPTNSTTPTTTTTTTTSTEVPVVMKSCTKKYCGSCLWNRYMIRISDCMRYRSWKCPFCENKCNCSACLKRKGVDPSNLDIPFAAGHGAARPAGLTHKPPRPRIRRKSKATTTAAATTTTTTTTTAATTTTSAVIEEEEADKEKDIDGSLGAFMLRSIEAQSKRTKLGENTQRRKSPFCVTVGNLSSVPARV